MHVCILTSQYFGWGKIGGFGSMSRRLAEALAADGLEVSVIVPRRPGQPAQETVNGVDVRTFSSFDFFGAIRLIKQVKAQIFHSQDPTLLTALAQWFRSDAKHIVTCRDPRDTRDWITEFRDATWGRRLKVPLNWLLEGSPIIRRAVRRADGVYTPAFYLQDKVRRMYQPKCEIGMLPNLIDVPESMPQKAEIPTFTFIGRLDKRKRPEMFLALARQFPDYRFVVVGKAESEERDKELRDTYASLPNVDWVGYVDKFKEKEKMERILSETWVLVNTASREGLPLTFLEAAGHGCAIISAVNPDDFATRFGVHVTDDDFASAIRQLMENREAVCEFARQARAYVQNTYELSAAHRIHLDAYDKIFK